MAPASKENRHQTETILKKARGPRLNPFLLFPLFCAPCDLFGVTFSAEPIRRQPVVQDLCYEILQFLFEDDEEFFGGLCGGLKDFDRFRLLALLPPLPEAALLATE